MINKLTKTNYIGPELVNYDNKNLLIYIKPSTGYKISYRAYYGAMIFSLPRSIFIKFFTNYDSLNEAFSAFSKIYFKKINPIDCFKKKGIILSSEQNMTSSYIYILGEKKKVVSNLNEMCLETFYASNYDSEFAMFTKLALNYFTKRVDELCKIMNLENIFTVRISNSISYLGSNNTRSNVISLDSCLYSYKKDVADAIIIHELSHFFYHNHSKDFYKVVLKYCPNYYKYTKIISGGHFEDD